MARLPADLLAQINAIPSQHVRESTGHELRPAGAGRWSCSCPLPGHDDRTPSFFVTEDKNLWKCFGACDTGGDVIALVQKLEACGFIDAVAWLARFAQIDFQPAKYQGPQLAKGGVPAGCPLEPGLDAAEIGRRVVQFYHGRLLDRKSAGWQYLASRGLADDRLIDRFRLGYAPMGADALLRQVPDCQRKAGKEIRADLVNAGWSREFTSQRAGKEMVSARESFSHCVTVPVLAADGSVQECYGRKAVERQSRTPVHWYLPGMHRGVWNAADCIAADGSVIICEAAFDALTLWRHGMENVTFAYGTGGFTADHEALVREGAKTIYIAFDNDDAGNKAAEKLSARLQAFGLGVYRVLPPAGQDINQVAVAAGEAGAAEALRALLRAAQWWGAAPVKSLAPVQAAAVPEQSAAPVAETVAADAAPAVEEAEQARPPAAGAAGYRRDGDDVHISLTSRRYRLRGLLANKSDLTLKAQVRVSCGDALYADSFDLYQAKARSHFVRAAAVELGLHDDVLRADVAQVLRLAEQAVDDHRAEVSAASAAGPGAGAPDMTDEERQEALELLKDPDLLRRIAADLSACGLVGEATNKLTCYLAATSRLMDDPLGVIIQSSSAAGKSSLMDAVLKLMPEESVTQYSAMTEQSLFYQGTDALRHRILAIAEEAGAGKIAYSLKILISDHYLAIAAPRQNPETGCFETISYRVDGPTAVLMTTTADDDDLDAELLNRCLVLSVDETADQTAGILGRQRARFTADGQADQDDAATIRRRHHNAQRLLKPLRVVIPMAEQLTFATHLPRLRRDHMKYLNMICCIALLHQHQREAKRHRSGFEYIEATIDDVAAANEIIASVLGRSIAGMLPHTRELLTLIDRFVTEAAERDGIAPDAVRFSRRNLREWCGWGDTRLKKHLARLVDWEILSVHRQGGTAAGLFLYQMHYTAADMKRLEVRLHLIDPSKLAAISDSGNERSHLEGVRSPLGHPSVTGQSPLGHTAESGKQPVNNGANADLDAVAAKQRHYGGVSKPPSQVQPSYLDDDQLRGQGAA